MTADYTNVMSEHSDKTLAKILTEEKDNYQPEAVEAAEREFERRQLKLSDFAAPAEDLYTEEEAPMEISVPGGFSINQSTVKAKAKPEIDPVYDEAKKKQAQKDMLYGGLWCAGGLIATMADVGAIFWGAIVFGGIQFFKGLSNS